MKPTLRQTWPYLLLVGLAVAFLGDIWFWGKILLMRDFFAGEAAFRSLFGASIRAGKFNLWLSSMQCGIPLAAHPYLGTFYPPNWIFILPSIEWAARIWWTFHFAVAGMAAYALARYWRVSVAPALLAGVSFAFNTYTMAWAEFSHGFSCLVWLPLGLLFISKIIDKTTGTPGENDSGKKKHFLFVFQAIAPQIIALSALWAVQILADCEFFFYSSLLTGGFILAKWIKHWNKRTFIVSGFSLALAGVLALALAMPQLGITFELMGLSERQGEVDPCLNLASAHPRLWLSALLPFLYGRPGYPEAYWGKTVFEFGFGTFYVGILPLFTACFCWLCPNQKDSQSPQTERRFFVWFCLAAIVCGGVLAAGQYTPVYMFLHHLLPGFSSLRFPTKFFLFVVFALSMLGAFGFQAILDSGDKEADRQQKRIWQFLAGFTGLMILFLFVSLFSNQFITGLMGHNGNPSAMQLNGVLGDFAWAVLFAMCGVGLLALLIFRFGNMARAQGVVVGIAFLNLCLISRQTQVTVASGIYSHRPTELLKMVQPNPQFRILTIFGDAQQFLYGEKRLAVYDWAINASITNHCLLEGYSILSPGGLMLARYARIYDLIIKDTSPQKEIAEDLLSHRTLISARATTKQILNETALMEVIPVDRPSCCPRAFLASQWVSAKDEEDAFKIIFNSGIDLHKSAVIESIPKINTPSCDYLPDAPNEKVGEITSFEDQSDSLSMKVWTEKRALLVLGDSWYPGWSVTVDGAKKPIYRANYHFRGVFLEPGEHNVRFTYRSARFAQSIKNFILAVLFCGALYWFSRIPSGAAILVKMTNRRARMQKYAWWKGA